MSVHDAFGEHSSALVEEPSDVSRAREQELSKAKHSSSRGCVNLNQNGGRLSDRCPRGPAGPGAVLAARWPARGSGQVRVALRPLGGEFELYVAERE